MDNFRKHKKNRTRPAPVDGFVGRQAKPRPAPRVFNKTTDRPQLGNFRRTEGMHPIKQGHLGFEKMPTQTMEGRQPVRDHKGNIKVGATPLDKPAKKIKKPRHFGVIAKRGALALLVIVLLGTGFFGLKIYQKSRKILGGGGGAAALQENVDPTKLHGEGDGRVNVLLLGRGGLGHDGADLTDTILIASIDPVFKEAAIVSIPRDLYVKTPSSGSMKINAVYATAKNKVLNGKKIANQQKAAEDAGFKAIEDSVKDVLGIPIHYHGMVDFTGFRQAVDAVGGVDITAPNAVYEVMRIDGKNYTLNVKPGLQHFDGFRALAYSRSRHTSARGDFDRAERQRLIMVGLKNKVFTLGTLSNPLKVNQLLDALGDHVQTNFTQSELMRLYEIGKSIDSSKVESVGLADPPNNYLTTGMIGNQSVVLPTAGVNNYKAIQNFIRNKLRDGYLRQENASIAIYNGTSTAGLGAKTAENLKSYGYNVVGAPADAPTKTYSKTVIVDMRSGAKKYTKHYLEERFDTTVTTTLPDGIQAGTADFVIIVGSNEVTRLNN